MGNRFHEIDTATEGTFQWLFTNVTYRDWATCDRGLLWIKGNPGSGKSTLMRYALKNITVGDETLVLSHFFHGSGTELQRTPLGFFRSILHQLLTQVPRALSGLVTKFKTRCIESGAPGEKWQWHKNELYDILVESLPKVLKFHSVLLFVDALDECGERDAVDLISKFRSLLEKLAPSSSEFRVCCACRQYPVIDLDTKFQIRIEDETKEDISTYVQTKPFSKNLSPLQQIITDRAQGVFMWAELVIYRVFELERKGLGVKAITKEVYQTPKELYGLYGQHVKRMDDKPTALKLVEWVTFAVEPLTLEELSWAMVVEPGLSFPAGSLQELEDEGEYDSDWNQRIKSLSCGLVEAVSSKDTLVVQFIHQSVKEFFTDDGLLALSNSLAPSGTEATKTELARGVAQYRLSKICIRYLAMCEVNTPVDRNDWDILEKKFPFLRYTTMSWIEHASQGETSNVAQDELDYFDWPSGNLLETWRQVYASLDWWSDIPTDLIGATMVHVLSYFGLARPLQTRLQKRDHLDIHINARDMYGRSPLALAAARGHQAVVELLLTTEGVDIDAKDELGQTPTQVAVKQMHQAIVELLLATGKANIDTRGKSGSTLLS